MNTKIGIYLYLRGRGTYTPENTVYQSQDHRNLNIPELVCLADVEPIRSNLVMSTPFSKITDFDRELLSITY